MRKNALHPPLTSHRHALQPPAAKASRAGAYPLIPRRARTGFPESLRTCAADSNIAGVNGEMLSGEVRVTLHPALRAELTFVYSISTSRLLRTLARQLRAIFMSNMWSNRGQKVVIGVPQAYIVRPVS